MTISFYAIRIGGDDKFLADPKFTTEFRSSLHLCRRYKTAAEATAGAIHSTANAVRDKKEVEVVKVQVTVDKELKAVDAESLGGIPPKGFAAIDNSTGEFFTFDRGTKNRTLNVADAALFDKDFAVLFSLSYGGRLWAYDLKIAAVVVCETQNFVVTSL